MSYDDMFRSLLARRIQSFREHEAAVQSRIDALAAEKDSIVARRRTAEELYQAEFGELEAWDEDLSFEVIADAGPLTGLSWAEAMTQVLRDAGEPLHVKEIWQRLQAGGFHTDARDPVRSVVAIAVRDTGAFPKAGPNRYGLATARAGAEAVEGGDA